MPINAVTIIGAVCAVVATVFAAIYLLPKKRVPMLNKFTLFLHNIINFKTLLIEKILKILYIFSTCYVILTGFFMLFSLERGYSYFGYHSPTTYYGGWGLLLMILGPIVIRLAFEMIMMFVILVNNSIEIRNHLCDAVPGKESNAQGVADYVFCTHCGTRYDKNSGSCPNGCTD